MNEYFTAVVSYTYDTFIYFIPIFVFIFVATVIYNFAGKRFLFVKTDDEIEEENRRKEIYDGCCDIMEQVKWENMPEWEWRKLQYEAGIQEKEKMDSIKRSADTATALGVINLFH